uniref:hypothetical protein n=1 Tax=Rhizobium terrae TaxID=2171756 RepID=UPI001D01A1B9|nr:hypothetical protein [Rhizobium terrae]
MLQLAQIIEQIGEKLSHRPRQVVRQIPERLREVELEQACSLPEPFEPQIRAWLEADPAVSAASVLERLMSADPSRFTKRSLRTVQMAVKAWRIETAGLIILDGDWIKGAPLSSPAAGEDNGHLSEQNFGNIPG